MWVEKSAKKFFPNLSLGLLNIKIISAKHEFQKCDINPWHWKYMAFKEQIQKNKEISKIISIGDSETECVAVKYIRCEEIKEKKIIKFTSKPSIDDIIFELNFVMKNIAIVSKLPCNLFIEINP